MAIQVRRGSLADYDVDKMVAGELAVTTDVESEDQQVFVAFAPGVGKRILTEDDEVPNIVQRIWTGVCETSAYMANKIVTLDNPIGFSLVDGATVAVYFADRNTASSPKLNVNGTGAVSVKYSTQNSDYAISDPYSRWGIGIKFFTYKNGAWILDFGELAGLAYTIATRAPLASPALTGTPTAPTATTSTNNTQIATTAFVKNAISGLASTLTATESDGVVTLSIS